MLVTETLGFASIYPIVSFLENSRDVSEFEKSSTINSLFIQIYEFFGVSISLISMMLVTLGFIIFRQLANYFFAFYTERLKWKLGVDLGALVLQRMLKSRAHFIHKLSRGNLIVSIDYECQAAATIILVYVMLFQLVMSFFAYFALSFYAAPIPTIASVITLATVSIFLSFLIKRINVLSRQSVLRRQEFTSLISEIYGAWKIIKINSTEVYELNRFNSAGYRLVDLRTRMAKTSSKIELIFVPVITTLLLSSVFIMIEIFSYPIATITLYLAAMTRMLPMAQNFQRRFAQLAQYDPSLEKIQTLISSAEENYEITDTGSQFSGVTNNIEFKNVSFSYNSGNKNVIDNLSLSFPAGSLNAIIGYSGSGKTTLIDLVCQILTPTAGNISIDEQEIAEFSLKSLRKHISVVNQDSFLFNTTIYENLSYGNNIKSETEIWSALQLVDMKDFVAGLPKGLQTELNDGASNLSGGQRQRLTIARAILKKSSILILDEPTSALDLKLERLILKSLSRMIKETGLTIFVVTHNTDVAKEADIVIHLENGELRGYGTPKHVLQGYLQSKGKS